MNIIMYILLGLTAGIVSGLLGLGGGAVLVPALVFFFGLTQHQAQGTTLAIMLPPVFILAVLRYYYAGHVKVMMAIFAAVGLTVGAFLGAQIAQQIPDANLKKLFGVFLIIIGLKMVFIK